MPQVNIFLLGSFEIAIDGEPLPLITSERARALFCYLVVEAERVHSRRSIAGLLWPDVPQDRALQNLRQALTVLRKAFDVHEATQNLLIFTRQTLQFNLDVGASLDVSKFATQLAEGDKPGADRVTAWVEAVTHYRGEFLQSFGALDSSLFEDWVLIRREHYARQVLRALRGLANHFEQNRDYETVLEYAQRQLAIEPWQEDAHRQVMRCLAHLGQRTAAIARFEICRRVLEEELAVEPAADTVNLFEQIRNDTFGNWKTQGDADSIIDVPPQASPVIPEPSIRPRQDPYVILGRLDPLPDQQLFGVKDDQAKLEAALQDDDRPWIIAIDGIGGLGKTTLAHSLVHGFVHRERFADIGWVSAKQEEFLPTSGISDLDRPALDVDGLSDVLLQQLDERANLSVSPREKLLALTHLLKSQPYLVVIDNLETLLDHEALLPQLRQWANPSKFLLTSRISLQSQSDVLCLSLNELSQADAIAFLQFEAKTRGLSTLIEASHPQLEAIYNTVGGNPLALKLVIGQSQFVPLSTVLENLETAQGKRVDELYTYIYWQAWQMMDDICRELFLSMPLSPNSSFSELTDVCPMDIDDVQYALGELIKLSLIEVGGTIEEPRYRLHRLTETFLMYEVLKWQT
ncbi:MAG: BTAD domain-containing putative transcriptional regulator [Chloroflexota bacterium]